MEPSFGMCFPPCDRAVPWTELAGVWCGLTPTAVSIEGRPKPGLTTFLIQVSQNIRASCSQDCWPATPCFLGWHQWPYVFCHLSSALCEGPQLLCLRVPSLLIPGVRSAFSLTSRVLWLWLAAGGCTKRGCRSLAGPCALGVLPVARPFLGWVCTHKACTLLVCFLFPTGPSSEVQKEKPNSPLEASEPWTHPSEHKARNQP